MYSPVAPLSRGASTTSLSLVSTVSILIFISGKIPSLRLKMYFFSSGTSAFTGADDKGLKMHVIENVGVHIFALSTKVLSVCSRENLLYAGELMPSFLLTQNPVQYHPHC